MLFVFFHSTSFQYNLQKIIGFYRTSASHLLPGLYPWTPLETSVPQNPWKNPSKSWICSWARERLYPLHPRFSGTIGLRGNNREADVCMCVVPGHGADDNVLERRSGDELSGHVQWTVDQQIRVDEIRSPCAAWTSAVPLVAAGDVYEYTQRRNRDSQHLTKLWEKIVVKLMACIFCLRASIKKSGGKSVADGCVFDFDCSTTLYIGGIISWGKW